MKGLILAAGRGKRLGELTLNSPKCMVELAGKPLLDYQIKALNKAAIADIGAVCGYKKEKIQDPRITMKFENPHWDTTNMVSSLMCASSWIAKDNCIISYSDIFYKPNVVSDLIDTDADIAISYDKNFLPLWESRFTHPFSDLESFRFNQDNTLLDIGRKTYYIEDIQGQYMGLIKLTPNGWRKIKRVLEFFTKPQLAKLDMTTLLQNAIKHKVVIKVVPYSGVWGEVDQVSDLKLYESWDIMNFV